MVVWFYRNWATYVLSVNGLKNETAEDVADFKNSIVIAERLLVRFATELEREKVTPSDIITNTKSKTWREFLSVKPTWAN